MLFLSLAIFALIGFEIFYSHNHHIKTYENEQGTTA
jgi:hypothetical protein